MNQSPDPISLLRGFAMAFPHACEGVACEGTTVEKRTIKAREKAFLFLGPADAMFKLSASLPEAASLASAEPTRYRVGAHGWVTATFHPNDTPPMDRLEKWVDESFRANANKRLVEMVEEGG